MMTEKLGERAFENFSGGRMMNVFELIIEKIKANCYEVVQYNNSKELGMTITGIKQAIDEVEEEYNNGWIPCNERQPEIKGMYLVTTKIDDFLRVRTMTYDGKAWIGLINTVEYGDVSNRVYAWQPLPETYKG